MVISQVHPWHKTIIFPPHCCICRSLRKLNVEGNQLSGLPYPAAHSLPLSQLLIGDNLTHPLLWRDNTRNQPQVYRREEIHVKGIKLIVILCVRRLCLICAVLPWKLTSSTHNYCPIWLWNACPGIGSSVHHPINYCLI